jgi:hypothetical protein
MAPTFDTSRCMIKPVSDRRAVFVFEKGQSPVVVIYEDLDYAGSLLESPGRPHRRRGNLAAAQDLRMSSKGTNTANT